MSKLTSLILDFSEASKQSGRSLISLFAELIRLRLGVGRLGASEYLDFRLYMNNLTFNQKSAFGGYRAEAILEEILIDDYARFLSLDKVSMYTILEGWGLPIPTIRAVFQSKRPRSLFCIETVEALAEYLRVPSSLPVYIKPSYGGYGVGNALVAGFDDGNLILGNGSRINLYEFCQSLNEHSGLGWILQEPLVSESSISEVCGNKLSGVRVHSFMSSEGPQLTQAIWKINVGTEDCDNFRDGESGNLAAALDINTGEVIRIISGIGLHQQVNVPHPKTGAQLVGFRIPYWNDIKSLVCDAHLAFPGFICPGWDIAVCDDGPKILEINFFGDIDLPQRAYGRGFMDDFFLSLMRGRGLNHLLFEASGNRHRSKKTGRIGQRKHHWKW